MCDVPGGGPCPYCDEPEYWAMVGHEEEDWIRKELKKEEAQSRAAEQRPPHKRETADLDWVRASRPRQFRRGSG